MYSVNIKRTKDVRINLKATEELRREFQVAAELRGSTMSNLIHQFIVATVWDEKKKHPEAFADLVAVAEDEPKPERTPTIHAPTPKPKPLRDSPSHQKPMHFGGKGAKSEADKQLSESEFERLRREQKGTESDEESPED